MRPTTRRERKIAGYSRSVRGQAETVVTAAREFCRDPFNQPKRDALFAAVLLYDDLAVCLAELTAWKSK